MNYSEQVKSYFYRLKHRGLLIGDNVTVLSAGGRDSEYEVLLYLRLIDDIIVDARFRGSADPTIIASLAWLCDYLEGQPVSVAQNIKIMFVAEKMGLDMNALTAANLLQYLMKKLASFGNNQ